MIFLDRTDKRLSDFGMRQRALQRLEELIQRPSSIRFYYRPEERNIAPKHNGVRPALRPT